MLAAINENEELLWVRVIKLDKQEKEKIELKNELKSQKSNILPENESSVTAMKMLIPCNDWKERMKNGDSLFTTEAIASSEKLLEVFVEQLALFTRERKVNNIYNSVKRIVKVLNKEHKKFNQFIGTLEREEICEFIKKAIQSTGFQLKEGVDVTEEWREW